jgi:hypothetical protein
MTSEISRRLIGNSAVLSEKREVIGMDLVGLVRRLLLFDKYVLVTTRLQEFPFLANNLGFEGLRDLLAANIIEIRCECLQFGQTGQSNLFGMPILPLFSYRFDWLDALDRAKYIRDGLQALDTAAGLRRKDVSKLKRAIDGAIRDLPTEQIRAEVSPEFRHELLQNKDLVRYAVDMVLRQRFGAHNVSYSLNLHQEGAEVFVAETDLHQRLTISELEGHKVIEGAMMGIAALSQTIAEMKHYSAISGFRDEELPLFRKKLDFLASVASSQTKEHNFQRVLDVAGLPDFAENDGRVSIEKLLKIRKTSEIREFRDWLGGIGEATDAEIKDRVGSLRAKAGLVVSGETGKVMRFLVTTAIGLAPHPLIATAIGAFDQFVVDRVLPRSGIAAFVNELYPSIFESKSS